MSLFDKLMFWKKEEEFHFDEEPSSHEELGKSEALGQDFGAHPLAPDSEPLDFSEPSAFDSSPTAVKSFSAAKAATPSVAPLSGPGGKDLELLNAKLDNIRLILSSIEQRLANMEAGEKKPPQKLW